jgi:hydrogenase nickel incorporation protein HypB
MCSTCGCGRDTRPRVTTLVTPSQEGIRGAHGHVHEGSVPHDHDHDLDQGHTHRHEPVRQVNTETLLLEQDILAKNDLLAARNRDWLTGEGITALNVMSSPGSGKTTLLARTITELSGALGGRPFAVVEGDQETLLDAERIRAAGAPVVQINTGAGCHLDADMFRRGLAGLAPQPGSVLFVENVGNLVCPALFDLGEAARVVVISVTEGSDKPLKYPQMFAGADLVLINKADLLPYVDFDVEACIDLARRVRPGVDCLLLSATTGAGIQAWYEWIGAAGP